MLTPDERDEIANFKDVLVSVLHYLREDGHAELAKRLAHSAGKVSTIGIVYASKYRSMRDGVQSELNMHNNANSMEGTT